MNSDIQQRLDIYALNQVLANAISNKFLNCKYHKRVLQKLVFMQIQELDLYKTTYVMSISWNQNPKES
jgi:hypothetical protein